MSKQSTIQIHDAKNKGVMAYRVKCVGSNGEPLCNSEVLESVSAVKKNIGATFHCFGFSAIERNRYFETAIKCLVIEDHSFSQKFIRYGAKSGLKVKQKSKKK